MAHRQSLRAARVAVAVTAAAVTVITIAFVVPNAMGSRSGPTANERRVSPAPPTANKRVPPVPGKTDPRLSAQATLDLKPGCKVSPKLVPSCGAWWGVAPGAFTSTPRVQALHEFERKIGRTVDIYHAYHRGTQIFPTKQEMAVAREPGKRRILLLNWKPDIGRSWASVAGGSMDGHIDRLAAHVNAQFPEKFFLVIHHEPEEEVRQTAGSGYTAADFRNMFRHVVQRFRAKGVDNILFTVVLMGSQKWGIHPWFDQLYPGGDVVDWVGMDPYASPETRDFSHLVNKTSGMGRGFPGYYNWADKIAPGKPIMIAEWGVFSSGAHKTKFFESVAAQFKRHPRVKALVYFESPDAPYAGTRIDTRIDSTPAALNAFTRVSNDPQFNPQGDRGE
jgi:hypothetical protein